jgi:hypothetical protein
VNAKPLGWSSVRITSVLPSLNVTVRMWQPNPQALNTTTWLSEVPIPLMLALPQEVPGAQLNGD